MQTLRNLQWTKDAGHHWYKLLVKIFLDLGLKPSSVCRGIWHWHHEAGEALLCLATDDMLFASTSKILYDLLLKEFAKYFEYTTRTGPELSFLNYRIVQSEWGISIDQTTHIRQNILAKYFPNEKETVPFYSSPFPKDGKIEMDLYQAPHLTEEELAALAKKHRGGFST